MCVRIDSTGNDKFACSIDRSVRATDSAAKILADHCDRRAVDQDIGDIGIHGRDDVSVFDQSSHRGKLYDRKSGRLKDLDLQDVRQRATLRFGEEE